MAKPRLVSLEENARRYELQRQIEKASRIALSRVKEFLEKEDKLDEAIFVLFGQHDLETYKEVAR